VKAGVDSVEHCVQLTVSTARDMAERGTYRGPTLSAALGMLEHTDEVPAYAVEKISSVIEDAERSHAMALRAHVRHVCSTDAGTPFNPHGNAPSELVRMVVWGMRPLDAMVAATSVVSICLVILSSKILRRVPPATFVPLLFATSALLLLVEWALVSVAPRVAARALFGTALRDERYRWGLTRSIRARIAGR
jgi:hypothetical protein